MALADFLDHKCDIYHLIQSKDSPGYGLPDSPVFNYNNKPDEKEIPCHFGIESLDAETEQKQPQNILRDLNIPQKGPEIFAGITFSYI